MAQGEKRPVVMEAAKGVPGGVASLGEDGKVPQEQLPEFGISNAEIKQKLVDDDCLAITDSEANNRTKRVFWSNIKEILGGLFVPVTRKINNKALSSDVSLNAADVGAVPTSRTVNGKALSGNISLTASDVGAALALHKHPASDITSGTLPISRGGTGKTSVGGTDYTTVRFRGSGLRNADTNPTDNGTINWTYG